MGRSATLLLCAIAGLSAVACPGSGSGDLVVNAAPRWASGQVVRYSGAEVNKAGQVIRDIAVTLDVQRDGSGLLTFQGLTVPMVLSPRGDLSVTDPDEPEFIYELPLIAVLPPEAILADGRPLVAGMTWSVSRPTDTEAASMSNSIVTQERFVYRVVSVAREEVRIQVTGFLRVYDNAVLRSVLANETSLIPEHAASVLAEWSRYLEGEAVFNLTLGSTREARGVRVPLGFLRGEDRPVSDSLKAISYQMVRS